MLRHSINFFRDLVAATLCNNDLEPSLGKQHLFWVYTRNSGTVIEWLFEKEGVISKPDSLL